MTPAQVIEAPALLVWSRDRLAAASDVGVGVVRTFEVTGRVQLSPGAKTSNERFIVIRAALEAAGVEFIEGDQPGVKLRARHVDE